ncbi:hypothetical protein VNO77_15568 [Canavalia gladiata]|uniref:Uncharacterized protein n=1 Tax=Canavalia gladiata TaxID=3824 RepID=A0AAN9M2U1_CANGL
MVVFLEFDHPLSHHSPSPLIHMCYKDLDYDQDQTCCKRPCLCSPNVDAFATPTHLNVHALTNVSPPLVMAKVLIKSPFSMVPSLLYLNPLFLLIFLAPVKVFCSHNTTASHFLSSVMESRPRAIAGFSFPMVTDRTSDEPKDPTIPLEEHQERGSCARLGSSTPPGAGAEKLQHEEEAAPPPGVEMLPNPWIADDESDGIMRPVLGVHWNPVGKIVSSEIREPR